MVRLRVVQQRSSEECHIPLVSTARSFGYAAHRQLGSGAIVPAAEVAVAGFALKLYHTMHMYCTRM